MRTLSWLAVVILVSPLVQATLQSEFSVAALALEGDGTVYGELIAVHIKADGAKLGLQDMIVRGERIVIETGHNERNLSAATVVVTPTHSWVTTHESRDAQITPTRVGERMDLLIITHPLIEDESPAAGLRSQRLQVQASNEDGFTRESRLLQATHPHQVANIAGSHSMAAPEGGVLQVEGDFMLVVWEMDLLVQAGDEQQDHWSGSTYDYYLASANGAPRRSEARELYVMVENGSLELESSIPWSQAYLHGRNAWANDRLELEDAVPLHTDPQAPRDRVLPGPILVGLSPTQQAQFTVGAADAAATTGLFNGGPTTDTALAPKPADAITWMWPAWIIPAAIGLFVGLAWRVRRARQDRDMERMTQAMDEADYREVTDQAAALLAVPRFTSEVVIMAAVSLLRLGREQEVLDLLQKTPEKRRPQPAACSYLQACALAQMRRFDEARDKLQQCLQIDPSFSVEVMNNPVVASLLRGIGGQAAAEGYA